MSWCGLGDRVIVMRVGEPRAAKSNARQTPGELRTESIEVVRSELVGRYEQNERRRCVCVTARADLRRRTDVESEAENSDR
jgi:hypothetical protein